MMKQELREWAEVLIKSVVIICCLYVFLWPFKIDGSSMEKNFSHGDRIAVSRALKLLNLINHGDSVVCNINERDEKIIKRVIGKPHDTIKIENGLVYRNGELLEEPYIYCKNGNGTKGSMELTLGDDEYFVMGDNRDISYDSRSIGPVGKDDIIGKVIVRWYPFNNMKIYL